MELPPLITIGLYGGIALFNIISLGLLAYGTSQNIMASILSRLAPGSRLFFPPLLC